MAKFLLVLGLAVGVAIIAYFFTAQRVTDQALQESFVALDSAITGAPEPAFARSWYDEPVNVALVAGGIALVVGGLGAVLIDASPRPTA